MPGRDAIAKFFIGRSLLFINSLGFILILLIGAIDWITGPQIVLSIFYLIPVALVAWYGDLRSGITAAFLCDLAMLLADISTTDYSSFVVPGWNAAARLVFFLLAVYIMRRRKTGEEKIHQLMRVKSEFTSMVSHELRTPLSSIREGLALVLDGSAGSLEPKQVQYLSIAKRNVDRLARLVNQVLSFQKLEAGRQEYVFERTDMTALSEEALNEFRAAASKSGARLSLDAEPDLPAVHCDRDSILQVLGNLLDNAIKYGAPGEVVVRVRRSGANVEVSVSDHGRGIRSEEQAKLFQGFTRIMRPGERLASGTGLGLAISKMIVERHGGAIGAVSEAGMGATFTFRLPWAEG